MLLAARPGFEPGLGDSKSPVLPLHHRALARSGAKLTVFSIIAQPISVRKELPSVYTADQANRAKAVGLAQDIVKYWPPRLTEPFSEINMCWVQRIHRGRRIFAGQSTYMCYCGPRRVHSRGRGGHFA